MPRNPVPSNSWCLLAVSVRPLTLWRTTCTVCNPVEKTWEVGRDPEGQRHRSQEGQADRSIQYPGALLRMVAVKARVMWPVHLKKLDFSLY